MENTGCFFDEADFDSSVSRVSKCASDGNCPHVSRMKVPSWCGIELLLNVGTKCLVSANDCGKPERQELHIIARQRSRRAMVDPVVVRPTITSLTPEIVTLGQPSGQSRVVEQLVVLPQGKFSSDARSIPFEITRANSGSFGTLSVSCSIQADSGNSGQIANAKGQIRVASRVAPRTPKSVTSENLVASLTEFRLSSYSIVGDYSRFGDGARNVLVGARDRIITTIRSNASNVENFLIWAAPGSGKSFFIEEIMRTELGKEWRQTTLNFTKPMSLELVNETVDSVLGAPEPCFTFVDEVDASNAPKGLAEALMRLLGLRNSTKPMVNCIVGSFGVAENEMKEELIRRDAKFKDCFDRVPKDNYCSVPSMDGSDQMVVFVSSVLQECKRSSKKITMIDKAALFYVSVEVLRYDTARQLSHLAKSAVSRCKSDTLLWTHMMPDEDQLRRIDFEAKHKSAMGILLGRYIPIVA